jgi:hypothetical protein
MDARLDCRPARWAHGWDGHGVEMVIGDRLCAVSEEPARTPRLKIQGALIRNFGKFTL